MKILRYWKIMFVIIILAMGAMFYWQKKGKLTSEIRNAEDKVVNGKSAPEIKNSEIEITDNHRPDEIPLVESAKQTKNEPATEPQRELLDSPSTSSGSLEEYKIDSIPFTPQAPFANWDEDRKEACEEAATIMVVEWLKIKKGGKSDIMTDANGWLDQNQTDAELVKMIDWQKQNYDGHRDLTIAETADFISKYYNGKYQADVHYDISIEDIKKEIAKGNPVIIPAAGREMGNRYFQTPGPIYHMTVIIGYDKKDFITNDPGTKRGLNYRYRQEKLFSAVHDWNGSPENIKDGRKGFIVILNVKS